MDIKKELSTTDNVEFLRQAAILLYNSNEQLAKEVARLKKEEEIRQLLLLGTKEHLSVLRNTLFGTKSERVDKDRPRRTKEEPLVHNQLIVPVPKKDEEIELKQEEIIHNRETIKEEIMCLCSNTDLEEMKGQFEESSEITVVERTYTMLRHKRQKYRCRKCNNIVTTKGPAKLKPGSEYSVDLAVQVTSDKFDFHLPLERQTRMMEECGFKIDTKTLYGLTEHLENLLSPICNVNTLIG